MINGTSMVITISRIDVIEAITEVVEGLLQDQVKEFVKGNINAMNVFSSFKCIPDWDNDHLGSTWCDLCSEHFFDENEDVDEVLMDITVIKPTDNNGGKGGVVQKMWLASREDVRVIESKMSDMVMVKV